MQFSSLQSVDASEDIGVPVDRVDTISLCRGDEGEMNSDSLSSCVGAGEQTVLSHEDPGFYRPLGLVVIDSNFGIFEKTGQGNPVLILVTLCWTFPFCNETLGGCQGRKRYDASSCFCHYWCLP